jgi:hypothetical protein
VRWRQLAADRLGYHVHQAANFLLAGFELVGGLTSHADARFSSPLGEDRSLPERRLFRFGRRPRCSGDSRHL